MQMIAPVANSALSSGYLVREGRMQMDLLGHVIANAGFGLILVAANRKIICANHVAEKLMLRGSGLRRERGCVCASDFSTSRKLQSLISSAASKPIGEALPGGSIILSNENRLAKLVVHVVPLAPAWPFPSDHDRPAAALFMVDCWRSNTYRARVFSYLFDLTPAEERVLAQAISGKDLPSVAKRLNIARSTARFHLDSILGKTGAHRQAELVRLFFETTIPWDGPVAVPLEPRNKAPTHVLATWRSSATKMPSVSGGVVDSQ
jgi:DNA-binding CsgD family transcriptional regulator